MSDGCGHYEAGSRAHHIICRDQHKIRDVGAVKVLICTANRETFSLSLPATVLFLLFNAMLPWVRQ